MIGIIVADSNEINKFEFKILEIKKINQFEFTVYENNLVVVHSGIGIANSAACTQSLINNFKPTIIYNYGAVGAFGNLNVYDIVTPEKIYYHDVVTPWYKRGQTPGEAEYYVNNISSQNNNNLASGSSFIFDPIEIKGVSSELNVNIFDMESAAIAQIATKNNVSLKIIKCVSDVVGIEQENLEDINIRIANAGKKAFEFMIKDLSL